MFPRFQRRSIFTYIYCYNGCSLSSIFFSGGILSILNNAFKDTATTHKDKMLLIDLYMVLGGSFNLETCILVAMYSNYASNSESQNIPEFLNKALQINSSNDCFRCKGRLACFFSARKNSKLLLSDFKNTFGLGKYPMIL